MGDKTNDTVMRTMILKLGGYRLFPCDNVPRSGEDGRTKR